MDSEFILLTLAAGTGLSFLFVDPPNKIHPVSWFGKLVSYFTPKLKDNNPKREKLNGIVFSLTLAIGISFSFILFFKYHLQIIWNICFDNIFDIGTKAYYGDIDFGKTCSSYHLCT